MRGRSMRSGAVVLLLAIVAGVIALSAAGSAGASATARGHAKLKVAPQITAPWAFGRDRETFDDPDPAASGLCRSSMFDSGNPYAPTSNVDLINGDAVNNSGFSNFGCQTAQNETTVAVNPRNPQNIVAGTNDYRVCCDADGLNDGTGWAYYSNDGGVTWHDVQLPGLTAETGGKGNFKKVDAAGDPAVAFGPDGTVYYANIVFSRDTYASGVAVSVSKDGGKSWGQPEMVKFDNTIKIFNDKEWVGAGSKGVVVTWTRFTMDASGNYLSSPIVMAVSNDHGRGWARVASPVTDNTRPYNQGSMPVFAPNGTLYVAYEGAAPETGYSQDATIVARSTDLGKHFTQTTIGRVYDDLDCYPTYEGSQTLTGEHFRLNSYPSISVDPTNGHVAVAWADDQGAGSCGTGGSTFVGTTNAHVKLVTSNDGIAYAPPAVVAGGDVTFPAVAANNGVVVTSYYTRAYSPDTAQCRAVTGNDPGTDPADGGIPVCLDYAATSSSDAFATETRLTTESSNPYIQFADGSFIGDYSQIALGSNGWAHPVWTDFRGDPNSAGTANQDAYTQSFQP